MVVTKWNVDRFQEVELRVGNVDESSKGMALFTDNPLVGTTGATNPDPIHRFDLNPALTGRYVTLQCVGTMQIGMYELDILI